MKGKNWLTKTKAGTAAAVLALAVWTGGCKSQEMKQPEAVETTGETTPPEVTTAPETTPASSDAGSQGTPVLRDARVMVEGRIYAWAYDTDFTSAPQDYRLAGEVAVALEEGEPQANFEAVCLTEGDPIYIRENGGAGTIFVETNGVWSAFIPYEEVRNAYEYSKESWIYDTSYREDGFTITFPDGSWQLEALGDGQLDSFAGKGGRVDIVHLPEDEAREIYPYIDTEEDCRELILNTGISQEFNLINFEAGLADSDQDPEASYYMAEILYTDPQADYRYEARYALYCGGYYWQLNILMKEDGEEAVKKAAYMADSFGVPTCKSQSIVLRYEGI